MLSLEGFGDFKFPEAGLLASSHGRGWREAAAELRAHPECDVPAICGNHMEITLAVDGVSGAVVERRGNGRFQRTVVRRGTLWLCPIGIEEDSIRITAPLSRILHLYLPKAQFERVSQHTSRRVDPSEIFYLAGVEDDFIRHCAYRVLRELDSETAGGSLLIESISTALALHLASDYSSGTATARDAPKGGLDRKRLRRVLDYIEAHLDGALRLADLAAVACLSPHHFARAFRDATGSPPHRYVSARRLVLAQQLLLDDAMSVGDVAIACKFSSQAAFTRAFQRKLGLTPGEYRRIRAHASR